jgi:hypothetical protein
MRSVLAVILVLFTGISLFSQAVIKEKVEITPKPIKNKVLGGGSHTISATFTWDNPQLKGLVAIYACNNWITDPNNWQPGGAISVYAGNVPAGSIVVRYYAQVSCSDSCNGKLKIYIDGSLTYDTIKTFNGQYLCLTYTPSDIAFNTPYWSDFTFSSDNMMCNNSISDPLTITPFYYYTDCSASTTFDTMDMITISITSGSEYVSLIKNMDITTASSSQTFSLSENTSITLWQHTPINGTDPVYAIIDANVNGIDHQNTVQILPPQFDLSSGTGYDRSYTVPGDISTISIQARDVNSCPSIFPDSTKFNVSILAGSNFGGLVDPVTGQISSILTGLSSNGGTLFVNFNANGDIPTQDSFIQVQISTTDATIPPYTLSILIKPAALSGKFAAGMLNPGDTTQIHIKELLPDGKTQEIPGQLFDVNIIEGIGSVFLMDPFSGQLTNSLTEVPNDFYIVAADSISTDSILVKLFIDTFGGGISSAIKDSNNGKAKHFEKGKVISSIIPGNNIKVKNPLMKTNKNLVEKANVTENKIILSTSAKNKKVAEYYGDFSGVADVWVDKPELKIIYPPNNKDEHISAAIMPAVQCKAKLINYKKGNVRFEWEYGISYTLKRKWDDKGNKPMCPRTGSIVFQGTSYSNNSDTTYWTVPFAKDSIKYISLVGEKYKTPNYCTNAINEWDEGNNVFIGGDTVYVGVAAYDINGNIINYNSIIPGKFLGVNPHISDIKAYNSGREIWAIIKKESSWLQFNKKNGSGGYNNAGMPIYGPPSGFGLMQLDNPYATETDLWNWKINVDDGANLFNKDKIKSLNHLEGIYPEIPDSTLLINAFQNYNGGNYYTGYNSIRNEFTRADGMNETSYGYKVYTYYLDPNL